MPNKAPSFQYYPKDWRADAVFTCSLAARGLWHELMNMMHAQERYGYLSHNGLPIPDEAISRYCGCTLQEYQTLLEELSRAGIPSRTSNGVIYSRRMVEDEKNRSDWRKRQQNHRDKQNARHGDVTPMSRLSSSASSSASPTQSQRPLPNPLMPQKAASREGQNLELCEWKVYGEWVRLKKPKRARMWTQREKDSLVGGRAEDYVAFFRSKGFEAEVFTPQGEAIS